MQTQSPGQPAVGCPLEWPLHIMAWVTERGKGLWASQHTPWPRHPVFYLGRASAPSGQDSRPISPQWGCNAILPPHCPFPVSLPPPSYSP